jgi:hypothetical protein
MTINAKLGIKALIIICSLSSMVEVEYVYPVYQILSRIHLRQQINISKIKGATQLIGVALLQLKDICNGDLVPQHLHSSHLI